MPTSQQTALDPDITQPDERLAVAHIGPDDDVDPEIRKLSDGYGDRLRHGDPMGHLLDDITRSLVAAGFVVHDCAAKERTGGVCLTPTTARQAGVIVTWSTHDALAIDMERYRENSDVIDLMNFALADVLCAMGWATEAFGRAGAHVVTGRLDAQVSCDE